jgi:hypothetical protein
LESQLLKGRCSFMKKYVKWFGAVKTEFEHK